MEYAQQPSIKERLDALPEPEAVGELLGTANSAEHAAALLARMEQEWEREQIANQHITARLAANLVDPVDFAVAAAIPALGVAGKLSKGMSAVRGAVAAGTANAAIEGVAAQQSPFRDANDVALAALVGITLGAPLGALGGGLDRSLGEAAENAARSAGAAQRVVDEVQDGRISEPLAARSAKQVNAALDEAADAPEFSYERIQKVQQNFIGRLFFSPSDTVRRFASRMLEGGHLKDRGAVRSQTAEGRAIFINREFRNNMMKSTRADFHAWAKERGNGWLGREFAIKPSEDFYSEVGRALRNDAQGVSPQAQAAASKIRPQLDSMYELAREAGVKGFDKDPLDNFFPRMHNRDKWLRAMDEYGEDNLAGWFRENILNTIDDLPVEVAERIARGYVKTISRASNGMDQSLIHGLPLEDMDRLRELLDNVGDEGGLSDSIVDLVEGWRAKRNAASGTVKHAKRRLDLDEGMRIPVRRRDGSDGSLALSDLLDNDARRVLFRYSQVMSGHIGLARHAGIKSRADLEALKKTVLDEANQAGGKRRVEATDEVQALDDAYKRVTGTSLEDDPFSTGSRLSRFGLSAAYVQYGGSFGVAQIPELGNIVGFATIGGFLKHLPDYRNLLSRSADGSLKNDLAETMDQLFAPGTDFIRNPALTSFGDVGEGFGSHDAMGRFLSAADRPLQSGARMTAALSLMAPINAWLQRAAGIQWASRLSDFATGTAKMGTAQRARLAAAGLDDAMLDRVFKSLKESAIYKGKRLRDIDVSKWADKDALDAFRMSGLREIRKIIQENNIGNTAAALEKPIGRVLTTFMSFMLNSINDQLLRGVHHRDIETFVSWTSAMFFASLAYTGQAVVDNANNPELLKKRLEPEAIAKAAFARAGFAAVMVPVIDNGLWAGGFEPWFSHARTSGLGTTLITSNPSVVLAQDALTLARTPFALLHDDYSLSQEDTQRVYRTMPFHRILAIRNAYAALEADLPRRSREE
jgi:hypothetical protein